MRPMANRLLLAFSLLGGALFASPALLIYRPWCAQYYGNNGGGTNCGFVSYDSA